MKRSDNCLCLCYYTEQGSVATAGTFNTTARTYTFSFLLYTRKRKRKKQIMWKYPGHGKFASAKCKSDS